MTTRRPDPDPDPDRTSMDRRKSQRVVVYRARVPEQDEVYEVEYESVADAVHFACRDLRARRREPIEILEDGAPVMDAGAIARHCEEEWQEVEELLENPRDDDEVGVDDEGDAAGRA